MHHLNLKHLSGLLYRRGVTLVELLIVLALVGTIMAIGFNFLLFGMRTSRLSEERAQHQFEVRMPVDFISKAVRFADSAQILSGVPTAAAGSYDVYLDGNQIFYNDNGAAAQIPGTTGVTDYTLTVTRINNSTLEYTIGKTGTTEYDVTTQVVVLNLPAAGSISGNNTGIGIRFTQNTAVTQLPLNIAAIEH